MEKIALLLVLYNDTIHLKRLLQSLRLQKKVEYTIFAIDCHPDQKSIDFLKKNVIDCVCYENKGNLGYAAGNNFLAKEAYQRGFIKAIICNTDIILESNCIHQLLLNLGDDYLFASPIIYKGTPESSKSVFSYALNLNVKNYRINHLFSYDEDLAILPQKMEVNYFSGCIVMINISHFLSCGQFYEEGFMYGEERDLALKACTHNFKGIVVKQAKAWHNHKPKSDWIQYDFSYYYIQRNLLLLCKLNKNWSVFFRIILREIFRFPLNLILVIKKSDYKGFKYYYKGFFDGLKGVNGKVTLLSLFIYLLCFSNYVI